MQKHREGDIYKNLRGGAITITGGIGSMEMAGGEKCVSSQSNSYSEMSFLGGGKGGGAFK